MKKVTAVLMALMLVPLAFMACGGGGGGGGGPVGPPLSSFEGDWYGPGEDDFFEFMDASLTINASGGITAYLASGVSTGLTPASFVVEDASSALITFSGGPPAREGGLFWDDSVTHMLFVDSWNLYAAVVEKNASPPLPAYAASDAMGTWSGYAYYFDAGGSDEWEKESPYTLTIAGDLSLSGNSPSGAFSGNLDDPLSDYSHGIWVGSITTPGPTYYNAMYLSPDKTFAGGYFMIPDPDRTGPIFPEEYIFLVLEKQ